MAEVLLEYKCPCCGGRIEFDSASQKMKCPYCDTEFEAETIKDYNDAVSEEVQPQLDWGNEVGEQWTDGETDGMNVYVCNSCGGEIVADGTTGATHCPYCDSPVVMKGHFSGDLKPNKIIPFKLDKEAAKKALQEHYNGKFLLPKAFKDENHIDDVKGVYVPFWMFDAKAEAKIVYKATKVRRWDDANYNYRETKYYTVIREGSFEVDNVPVDGSSKMPDDLMESIEPYDYSGLLDFSTAYLSGYLADKYDVTAEDSIARANERVRQSAHEELRETVEGFDTVTEESDRIVLEDGDIEYVLCPVWLLSTSWNGKNYLFAMNGQTGKLVGDLPADMKKFWLWLFIFGGIFSVVAYILITFLLG